MVLSVFVLIHITCTPFFFCICHRCHFSSVFWGAPFISIHVNNKFTQIYLYMFILMAGLLYLFVLTCKHVGLSNRPILSLLFHKDIEINGFNFAPILDSNLTFNSWHYTLSCGNIEKQNKMSELGAVTQWTALCELSRKPCAFSYMWTMTHEVLWKTGLMEIALPSNKLKKWYIIWSIHWNIFIFYFM